MSVSEAADILLLLHAPVSSSLLQDCVQLNQYKLKDEIGKVASASLFF